MTVLIFVCLFGEEVIFPNDWLFLIHLRRAMSQRKPPRSHTKSFWVQVCRFSNVLRKTGWVWGYRESAGEPSLGVSENLGKLRRKRRNLLTEEQKRSPGWGGGGEEIIGWEGTRGSRWYPPWSMICVLYLQAFARVTEWQSTCPWSQSSWVAMLACARLGALHSIVVGIGAGERGRVGGTAQEK